MTPSTPDRLIAEMQDAHRRTMALIKGLSPEQMIGPKLATVNPLLWEIGHAAYFYEYWVLRQHLGRAPVIDEADALYDSITIAHDDRWDLPLPQLDETLGYIDQVRARVTEALGEGDDPRRDYLAQYGVFHQDMHNEAYTYTRQTLGYPAPEFDAAPPVTGASTAAAADADVAIPGGTFMLGARPEDGFVFDNEKWAHPVEIAPFSIAKTAVSNRQLRAFVEAGGYEDRSYWDDDAWAWREQAGLNHPLYWRSTPDGWEMRVFDRWVALPETAAAIHVSWYEAQAYCRWADRRLPSEAEWEVAAAAEPTPDGHSLAATKRRFPWGDTAPDPSRANLDSLALGTIDTHALPDGDSAFGCRQMIGNAWEWTATTFGPYPGFEPDMYQDYSQPLFGITKVLRGGAWTTRGRMIRNTWRTYYGPERNDVFAGFRTCAIDR